MVEPPIWKIWASNWTISPIFGMKIQKICETTIPQKWYIYLYLPTKLPKCRLGYLQDMHHSLRSVTTQDTFHLHAILLFLERYERKWSENSKKHTKKKRKEMNLIQFCCGSFMFYVLYYPNIEWQQKISALYKILSTSMSLGLHRTKKK